MKKRCLLIAGMALLLLFYSGCNGNDDEQSTIDYSNDSDFQKVFAEIKNGLEESFSDDQIFDMTYEDNCVNVTFAANGDAIMLISHYNEEKWDELKSGLNGISNNIASQFNDQGYDVDVSVVLLNDQNTEETLYRAYNGFGIYDYFDN